MLATQPCVSVSQFFKPCILLMFFILFGLPTNAQNPFHHNLPKQGYLFEHSFNQDVKLWTLHYRYIILADKNFALGASIGYMFGEDAGDSFPEKVGGFPLGIFGLHGNPEKGHFFEWGGETNFPRGDWYSYLDWHLGYRYRPKNAGLSFGVLYKYYYQVFWHEHTVLLSVGLVF